MAGLTWNYWQLTSFKVNFEVLYAETCIIGLDVMFVAFNVVL